MTSEMRREIDEQPAVLAQTLQALLPQVPELRRLARDARQVLFIARGSSDNAGVYGQYLLPVHSGRLATLASPSVATAYHAKVDLRGTLAVALSQSGGTEEIVETLGWARDGGARTVAVTNTAGSPLTEVADLSLVTEAGRERAVPATKTYTCQLLAVAVLAHALAPTGVGTQLVDELQEVPAAVERSLQRADDVQPLVEALAGVDRVVVSGRGFATSSALELALKLEEACYLSAVGMSYADLLHGPIAVLDEHTATILVAADDSPVLEGTVHLAGRAQAAGAPVYSIGGGRQLAAASSLAVPGTDLPELVAPLALIVPGQLLAEQLARRRGIDPDSPRGLSKVTQTEQPG